MCFFVTIAFHTSPSMRHYEVVDKSLRKLAYLKDSNAAAHSVDTDIFQSSDSSICVKSNRDKIAHGALNYVWT